MSFEVIQYLKLLNEDKDKEAFNYRISNMPKTLYKYVSLTDDNTKLNTKKLQTLENNKIWLSTYNNLNDPYELKSLFFNKEILEEKGWPIDLIEEVMNEIRKSFLIGSFTKSVTDNMPMWAHYASNHKGFCIKYNVNDAKFIYKVSYEDSDRIPANSIVTNYLRASYEVYNNKSNKMNNGDMKYFRVISHLPIIKHNSWIYEDEYRIVFLNLLKDDKGRDLDIEKLGLAIDSIYIGSECSKNHRKELLSIGNKLKVNVYEMYLDEYNKKYSLQYRLLSN